MPNTYILIDKYQKYQIYPNFSQHQKLIFKTNKLNIELIIHPYSFFFAVIKSIIICNVI